MHIMLLRCVKCLEAAVTPNFILRKREKCECMVYVCVSACAGGIIRCGSPSREFNFVCESVYYFFNVCVSVYRSVYPTLGRLSWEF